MKSWELLIAGALVVAWVWMLGKPILTNLIRRFRNNSIKSFKGQQAVLSRAQIVLDETGPVFDVTPESSTPSLEFENQHASSEVPEIIERPSKTLRQKLSLARLGPVKNWLAQPLVARRLQVMLGLAIANVVSFFCLIAFKGSFLYLSGIMFTGLLSYLSYAAYRGGKESKLAEGSLSEQDNSLSNHKSSQLANSGTDSDESWSGLFERPEGGTLFDSAFFEPIAGLTEPIKTDEAVAPSVNSEQKSSESSAGPIEVPRFITPSRSKQGQSRRRKAKAIHIDSELDDARPSPPNSIVLPKAVNE